MGRLVARGYAELEEGSVIGAMDGLTRRPEDLLNMIGLMATAYSQQAFEEQRLGDDVWNPRMNPNIPGIINDVNAGRPPRPQRFTDRPALVDTGSLQGSVAHEVISKSEVDVGSKHPAAAIHQLGLPSDAPAITAEGQKVLWQWMKRQGAAGGGAARKQAAERKQKARERYTKRQTGIWKRALKALVDEEAAKRPDYLRHEAHRKSLLSFHGGDAKAMRRDDPRRYKRDLLPVLKQQREIKAKIRDRISKQGINSQPWRQKVEEMRSKLRGEKDAAVSAANERRDERLAKIRAKAAASPLFEAASQLGWLLNPTMVGAQRRIKHPARPFLGVPPALAAEVERELGVRISTA